MTSQDQYDAWLKAKGPSDQLGGLELFLNLQKVAYILYIMDKSKQNVVI